MADKSVCPTGAEKRFWELIAAILLPPSKRFLISVSVPVCAFQSNGSARFAFGSDVRKLAGTISVVLQ